MTDDRVRRFTRFQIVLHWAQAVPYAILLVTGAMAVCQRFFEVQAVSPATLSAVHHGAGLTLAGVLALLFVMLLLARQGGTVLRDVGACFVFRLTDLRWLVRAGLQTVWPRVKTPPAGRFNAGQKLHGAFIVLAVPAFLVTGLMLLREPSALAPRAVHVALALPAIGFLALHLFLALVNPSTRKALGAIFHGHVSRHYAESHHPLWVDCTQVPPHEPIVSWRAVLLALALVAGGAGAIVWVRGPGPLARRASRWAGHLGAEAMSPGPLAAGHADDPRAKSCRACHELLGAPPDSSCLACHPEIQRVQAGRIGYHGTLTGPCRSCHAEHAGRDADLRGLEPASFDHARARFDLRGKHAGADCDRCHQTPAGAGQAGGKRRYIGLEFDTCLACHKDPHPPAKPRVCTSCHSEAGWTGSAVAFDHGKGSRFPLTGKHASAACGTCHSSARHVTPPRPGVRAVLPVEGLRLPEAAKPAFVLRGVGRYCGDCHTDPHQPALGNDCQACHNPAGWTGDQVDFLHDRDSLFPLRGAHATATCLECHNPPVPGATLAESPFRGLGAQCADCHQDPHRATLKASCTTCHSEVKWTGGDLKFRHDRDSKYALHGRHTTVSCARCHKPSPRLGDAKFVGTPTQCAGCHEDPHRGSLGADCTPCHQDAGWTGKDLLFRHDRDSRYDLLGRHAKAPCGGCHKPSPRLGDAQFGGTPTGCGDCHKDPHRKQMTRDCATCHSEAGWGGKALRFVHNRDSAFRIDAIHAAVSCDACHKKSGGVTVYKPLSAACQACHSAPAEALAGKSPARAGKADPHRGRVKCGECHAPAVASPTQAQYAAACQRCHNARYRDLYLDWTRTLADRQARAGTLRERLRRDPATAPRAAEVARRMAQARAVGSHNVQLAREILDEILAEPKKE